MQLLQHQTEQDLETFRTHFPSTRVIQEPDYLVYSYNNNRHAASSCSEANIKIEQLRLPLVAILNRGYSSFIVKSNEIE